MKLTPNLIYAIPGTSTWWNQTSSSEWQRAYDQGITPSIDSRTIKPGDFFVPLKGSKQDGHAFIKEALEKGASGCFIHFQQKEILQTLSPHLTKNKLFIIAHDPLEALYELARAWRALFKGQVVGITGSVGKTTTKEMVAHILQQEGVLFHATPGNENSLIGTSLHLLRLRAEHKVGVFEVGISHKGEMSKLAWMVQPTCAVITAISAAHGQHLGTLESIAREKLLLFSHLSAENIGIINGDTKFLKGTFYTHPVIRFGEKRHNHVRSLDLSYSKEGISFTLALHKEKTPVSLPSPHLPFVYNSLAAAAVCFFLKLPLEKVAQALGSFKEAKDRFEFRKAKKGPAIFISDCYNANPASMKAAIFTFDQLKSSGKKILVLGDMLELGEKEQYWHNYIGKIIQHTRIDEVIIIGERFKCLKKLLYKTPLTYSSVEELPSKLAPHLATDTLFLFKSSRAVGLKEVVEALSL